MSIHTHAYARAGLIGNPSDGYFGKTISLIVRNFRASAWCEESSRIAIIPQTRDRLEFDDIGALAAHVSQHGYYGGVRLIKAAIKRFGDYCAAHDALLGRRNFTIRYETDIPTRVGLAGSSAIILAVLRALMRFQQIEIPLPMLANLALAIEVEELGIAAGLQDRVIQAYEGAVFMDFDEAHMLEHGCGRYEPLDPQLLPPLFIAYDEHLAEGTEVPHRDLRQRFERGEAEVVDAMRRFADLAGQARDLLVAGRADAIGPLMDANYDLRTSLCDIPPGQHALVETGRALGAAVKFAGSGGAVVGAYDGDPQRLRRLRDAYHRVGATLIVPEI